MANGLELYRALPKDELRARALALAHAERLCVADLIAVLSVIDSIDAFEPEFTSMFAYCLGELHFSESVTFGRIRVARLVQRIPEVLVLLRDSSVPLSHLERISSHLTPENAAAMVRRIERMSTRDLDRFVAMLAPRPDQPDSIRRLPTPAPLSSEEQAGPPLVLDGGTPGADLGAIGFLAPLSADPPIRPDRIDYLSQDRVCFRFTGGEDLRMMLSRLRDLLRRKYPGGELEHLIREAAQALLLQIDPLTRPAGRKRMTGTRTIPRWVKRVVSQRDGDRCTEVDAKGCRCQATAYLEYHHVVPWSLGGRSDDPDNLRRICSAHHRMLHEHDEDC